jgi:hypothetical protein
VRFALENMFVPGLGSYHFGREDLGFAVGRASILFQPWRSRLRGGPAIDAAWLEGAELVIVRSQYSGAVRRTLEIADFPLSEPAPSPAAPRDMPPVP